MTISKIMTALFIMALLMAVVSFRFVERDEETLERDEPWLVPVIEDSAETIEWTEAMVLAVTEDDLDLGYQAETHLGGILYDDVFLLSRFIEAMDKPGWVDSYRMAAGEVLINRMASPEFSGGTVREVLFARDNLGFAEFPVVVLGIWDRITPAAKTVRMAIRLLRGESVLEDAKIVYVGPLVRGGGEAWRPMVDANGNVTHLSRTSHPELYE